MRAYPGFSLLETVENLPLDEAGRVETEDLDTSGIPWVWGPGLAGPDWLPVVEHAEK